MYNFENYIPRVRYPGWLLINWEPPPTSCLQNDAILEDFILLTHIWTFQKPVPPLTCAFCVMILFTITWNSPKWLTSQNDHPANLLSGYTVGANAITHLVKAVGRLALKNFFQFSIPGTAEELTFSRWKSRIRDSPWRQPSSALKISGMLGGGARINLIFVRSCRTRFARVRGEKRFLKHKPKHKLIPTAFTRPAGLDLVQGNAVLSWIPQIHRLSTGENSIWANSRIYC